ncbi:hypothetical protein TTHERM_00383650 (macronuclear) [Tetrahymena thermophila SB210]|uniref:Uncharacterized protein n=1 Tax=Tetrahymena thermophila (strain SB210) TaxID=312017 RepID=Q23F48_TETTS|nr:hypothetical protein TTHERM_00383650 [Tetrahymena thermophila SB210]EAR95305.2 hypothetical protein TTHERM_00383650 [Tetrahymena thermophila SB210]|eukprot:XP_001015550.2 hypothetical protein TTHERM_00383650 [Tetrahymena thermophila SB210]
MLENSEIRKNFQVVSSFLYTLTRSESKTDEEFERKYNVYETLLSTNQRWGRNTQFVILGGLVAYCLKGNNIPIKLTGGFLYGYWIQHFYTLGSYAGVTLKLPCKNSIKYFKYQQIKTMKIYQILLNTVEVKTKIYKI